MERAEALEAVARVVSGHLGVAQADENPPAVRSEAIGRARIIMSASYSPDTARFIIEKAPHLLAFWVKGDQWDLDFREAIALLAKGKED